MGFGKPPTSGKFKRGGSGNPRGRPKGSKNFETVLQNELAGKIPVTENGSLQHISKLTVMTKQLVNKAAAGDAKAIQTVLNEIRLRGTEPATRAELDVFDAPEHQLVMEEIVRRIRLMDDPQAPKSEKGRKSR